MTVENSAETSGLARLDAVQKSVVNGQSVEPIQVPEIVRTYIPTTPTNRDRRNLKRVWPGLKELAQQELGQ